MPVLDKDTKRGQLEFLHLDFTDLELLEFRLETQQFRGKLRGQAGLRVETQSLDTKKRI